MGQQGTSGMRGLRDVLEGTAGGTVGAGRAVGQRSGRRNTTRRQPRSPITREATPEALVAQVAAMRQERQVGLQHSSDLPPRCAQCGGAGWVRVAGFGVDGGWRVELAPCACQRESHAAAQWRRALDASDMTPALLAKTFVDYDPSPDPSCVVGRDAALCWAESVPDAALPWLVLYGNTGTGKTHLLAAAFNLLMASGYYPLYTLVPALLDYVRQGLNASDRKDGGGEYAARFAAVQQAPILILDDLGAEMRTPWTDETLFKLLDDRYRRGLPTAVASNLIPAHLEPRIASRLQDRALSVSLLMSGPDYRLADGNTRKTTKPEPKEAVR